MSDEYPEQRLARLERKINRLYSEFTSLVSAGLGVLAAYWIERSHWPLKDWIAAAVFFAVMIAVRTSFERGWD